MSVTPAGDLAGLLPVVISGGRPVLSSRPTARLLGDLAGVTADPVWLVRDDRAPEYEADSHEIVTFGRAEAEEYAAARWLGPEPFGAGAFLGCFTEREWACRLAEARGYWGVLQLDDNLSWLGLFTGTGGSHRVAVNRGGLGLFADVLAAVTLASNSRMTGAALDAVNPATTWATTMARTGFPYSLFVEVVGPGREDYFGPVEEDILHAYTYGANASTATAALVPALHYRKEYARQDGGMRPHYRNHRRAVGLQRAAPEMAKLQVRAAHTNGQGGTRVFHTIKPGSIRTPLAVTNRPLWDAARGLLTGLASEVTTESRLDAAAKVAARAARVKEGQNRP